MRSAYLSSLILKILFLWRDFFHFKNFQQQRCCKRRSRDANAAESFASGPDEAADEESVTSAEEGEPAGEVAAELRARTRQLARRQAQRAELLQRAEAAWQDLERGFQKKLQLSKEKEENIAKQVSMYQRFLSSITYLYTEKLILQIENGQSLYGNYNIINVLWF